MLNLHVFAGSFRWNFVWARDFSCGTPALDEYNRLDREAPRAYWQTMSLSVRIPGIDEVLQLPCNFHDTIRSVFLDHFGLDGSTFRIKHGRRFADRNGLAFVHSGDILDLQWHGATRMDI